MLIGSVVQRCNYWSWLMVVLAACLASAVNAQAPAGNAVADGVVLKQELDLRNTGENLLQENKWQFWQNGFVREKDWFVCDNGTDDKIQRGVSQTVTLNQQCPTPVIAEAWSKADNVSGSPNSDYSLYLDLAYTDGTMDWGHIATFKTATHDWEKAEVRVFPKKPIRSIQFHMLLRRHAGQVWFRQPSLRMVQITAGTSIFDGVAIETSHEIDKGFQLRDVAAGSGFVHLKQNALGIHLDCHAENIAGTTFYNAAISLDTDQNTAQTRDRSVTLIYALRIAGNGWRWFADPRHSVAATAETEYLRTNQFQAGINGRLSWYPIGALGNSTNGVALGLDMDYPAFYRIGYNSYTRELYIAYDIALTAEKPTAIVRFCQFDFDPQWEFRGALDKYYKIFPQHFTCLIKNQGIWMPFAKISQVAGWEDFGFRFKEGNNETAWDDDHGIITFRYTEPMTWWMPMPQDMQRSLARAEQHARQLAAQGNPQAQSLLTSGFHDESGNFIGQMLDTPWCNGTVWSMNSIPTVKGDYTDFKNKWNEKIRRQFYGPGRNGDLDGEYIDSSEGYVTAQLDFRREHFAAADRPLTFSTMNHRPAIFRGLITFEMIRAFARDVHGMDKLMMANSTPDRLCWLAGTLDVMGTETNWMHDGKWSPMSDENLIYRRVMCKGKPFCFLMNTNFDEFPSEMVEKYMKRSLAYGMFPGFFSHNASQGHYFSRPELYNRDRLLFKKYIPLCQLLANAGWEPITLAKTNDENVYLERFGKKYLTVFNDSRVQKKVKITLSNPLTQKTAELVTSTTFSWQKGQAEISLEADDVALIELP
ncbi:MAG: hypothetical protein JXD22_08240 [Sedimentisphaerales bacterium]|nr:hypothetical protein [Sedimentisphaerales bacterium]